MAEETTCDGILRQSPALRLHSVLRVPRSRKLPCSPSSIQLVSAEFIYFYYAVLSAEDLEILRFVIACVVVSSESSTSFPTQLH